MFKDNKLKVESIVAILNPYVTLLDALSCTRGCVMIGVVSCSISSQ